MAAAITDFLHRATLLCLSVSKGGDASDDGTTAAVDASKSVPEFQELVRRLSLTANDSQSLGHDACVHDLAKACWKVSRDILLRLQKPEDVGDQPGARASASGPPDKVVWDAGDVEALGLRLSSLRSQWKSLQPAYNGSIAEVSNTLSRLSTFTVQQVHQVPQDTPNREPDVPFASAPRPNSAVLSAFRKPTKDIPAYRSAKPRPAASGLLNDFILESLSFRSMRNREEEVADAHGRTFDWLFNPSQSHNSKAQNELSYQYTKWLTTDDLGSIYWVTGKPGSGKSTLMRYIAEHDTTAQLLQTWAGGDQLARAAFYFWTSGSEEQRSQTGLLRYLLHQLLSVDTDMISQAFPSLWQKLSYMSTKERVKLSLDWSVPDLMDALRQFLKKALPRMKICLIVDGLDEFDGDHDGIIHFFKDLAEGEGRSRIKMCLSSRPWDVFERAFEYSVPNLKLQDLTFQDMSLYVRDNLQNNAALGQFMKQDPKNSLRLIHQVVQQADGIFLWIRLAVRKVLETFEQAVISLEDIQSFVKTFPTDLDEFFERLLFHSQNKDQLTASSHIFQLVKARETAVDFIKDESSNSLTIWEFAYSLFSHDDGLAIDGHVEEISDKDIMQRCLETRRHILLRSVGLLEIYAKQDRRERSGSARFGRISSPGTIARELATNRVTYLHRTVRDYLMLSPNVWGRLTAQSSSTFDPHLRLVRSYVLRLKHSLEPIEHHRRLDEWYPDIALSLTHARYIENDPLKMQTPLINELEGAISWYWANHTDDPYDHWARACFGSYEARKGNKIIFPLPFVALCVKFGLERYVLDTIDTLAETGNTIFPIDDVPDEEEEGEEPLPPLLVEETPLLTYALEFLTSRQKTLWPLSSPSLVSALLQSPHLHDPELSRFIGTPNTVYTSALNKRQDVTPWIMALRHLRDAKRRGWIEPFDVNPEGTKRWTRIVKMLAQEGGADFAAVVKEDSWDPKATVEDVITGKHILGSTQDWWIHELQDWFRGMQNASDTTE